MVVGAIIMFNKKSANMQVSYASNVSAGSNPANTLTSPSAASSTPSTDTTTNTTAPTTSNSKPSANASGYKDGTYTVTADYYTPEDTDTIKVTLAVKDGVVSGVTSTTTTSSRESRQYDSMFLNAYKSYVVGKSLKDLNLNRVSGASLTTEGFNNALDMIRQQAQA